MYIKSELHADYICPMSFNSGGSFQMCRGNRCAWWISRSDREYGYCGHLTEPNLTEKLDKESGA